MGSNPFSGDTLHNWHMTIGKIINQTNNSGQLIAKRRNFFPTWFNFWNNFPTQYYVDMSQILAFDFIDSKFFDHFDDCTMNSLDRYYLSHYYLDSLLYVCIKLYVSHYYKWNMFCITIIRSRKFPYSFERENNVVSSLLCEHLMYQGAPKWEIANDKNVI